jgi:hypothetical protein
MTQLELSFLGFLLLLSSTSSMAGMMRHGPESFDRVLLEVEGGKVQVIGGGEGVIETQVDRSWNTSHCELYSELDNRTLKIKMGVKDTDRDQVPAPQCSAQIRVKIPASRDLEIQSEKGSFSIQSMNGKSKIHLNQGDLNIRSDLSELEVRGHAVHLASLGSIPKMKIDLEQKNLSLEMKKLGNSPLQQVAVDVSYLKTEVVLPTQARVKTRFSGDGIEARLHSEFPQTNEQDLADFELKINSDQGAVGVIKI